MVNYSGEGSESSSSSDVIGHIIEERDEAHEVKKRTHRETANVVRWRNVVTMGLVCTAVAVVITTFLFLKREESKLFETAFDQFSRTLSDAAVKQQTAMINGYSAMAKLTAGLVENANQTWPLIRPPKWELYAADARKETGVELFTCHVLVDNATRVEFEQYARENVKDNLKESHLIRSGHLGNYSEENLNDCITLPKGGGVFDCKPPGEQDSWPQWLYSPPPVNFGSMLYDAFGVEAYYGVITAMVELRSTVFTNVRPSYTTAGSGISLEEHAAMHSRLPKSSTSYPHSVVAAPIFEVPGDETSKIVALHGGGFAWDFALRNLLPDGVRGLHVVLANTCNQTYTYLIDGQDALYLSEGDLHDKSYDSYLRTADLNLNPNPRVREVLGHCIYEMRIYPTPDFELDYRSNVPALYACLTAITFSLLIAFFYVYDFMVRLRNMKMINAAARSNAIVTSMFPGAVRDKLLGDEDTGMMDDSKASTGSSKFLGGGRTKVEKYISTGSCDGAQIAELFLDATVIFMDICGFTAWSSTRHPDQVFTLLQAVYQEFDRVAKLRGVFKIETIGDCWVGVVGVPMPVANHSAIAVRFASDCIGAMKRVARKLELSLGPDTADLDIRVGIHSGPVTAGVLKGDRARFQLFGDTVNTTARLESTAKPAEIHVSQETAKHLSDSGKQHWVIEREDPIFAKGKGSLVTYWVNRGGMKRTVRKASEGSCSSEWGDASVDEAGKGFDRLERLIDWNVSILLPILKAIVARREALSGIQGETLGTSNMNNEFSTDGTVLDEVKEIIALPEFDVEIAKQENPENVVLPVNVKQELQLLISCIAATYRSNPFHSFEHASHVVMSVVKLLSRIVAPETISFDQETTDKEIAATLHDHTYGITSDPLTQFACAFSAIIHDADHTGVANPLLAVENPVLANKYFGRSIAEQHSFDITWDLLMDERFQNLRKALCPTVEEQSRFRQLVVNGVMATDISDKELKALRNGRWEKAFGAKSAEPVRDAVNRKATIVIEHLIQASDVSHTMQHWTIYRKWNENLFAEMMDAYNSGRSETNPADSWYKGEIGFFDFYIIPLAKKLKECGVFGVSSGEYLKYAIENRRQWEEQGQAVVAELVQAHNPRRSEK